MPDFTGIWRELIEFKRLAFPLLLWALLFSSPRLPASMLHFRMIVKGFVRVGSPYVLLFFIMSLISDLQLLIWQLSSGSSVSYVLQVLMFSSGSYVKLLGSSGSYEFSGSSGSYVSFGSLFELMPTLSSMAF